MKLHFILQSENFRPVHKHLNSKKVKKGFALCSVAKF